MVSRWALALVVAVTLGVGCGGSDDNEGTATNLDESDQTTSGVAGGGDEGEGEGATTSSVGGSTETCEVQGGVATQGTEVQVTFTEWKIALGVAKAGPGIVTFLAENTGEEPHELLVVKGESADALPKDADGALDEAMLPEGALIGEIEPMGTGQVCRGNFALQAANYQLVCNVVEEDNGVTEAHLAEGMHTAFTVGT